jgi:multisubunit Na+/H+ antiporter MnhG subunit
MSTRGIVLTTIGVFLLAMSVLGEFESVHHSAHIFYGVLIPVSLVVVALGLRSRKVEP